MFSFLFVNSLVRSLARTRKHYPGHIYRVCNSSMMSHSIEHRNMGPQLSECKQKAMKR